MPEAGYTAEEVESIRAEVAEFENCAMRLS